MQTRSATTLTVLLALVVTGSLLAVGTVHVAALLFMAPASILAGAIAIWVEDQPKRRIPLPALVATVLSLYSLLQSIPIPPRWLAALSPFAAQTWRDAFRLANEPATRWASVSMDPGASRVEALKWLCYAAVFIATARVAREKGSQRGAALVLGAALLGGILSVAHGLFGVQDWLGLYHPQMARPPWAPAPLLNPNNFAGYLNLALFTGLGMLFVRTPIAPRWMLGLSIVILAALVILSGSRGGVLALVVGFGLSGVAYRAQQVRAAARDGFVFPTWIPLAAVGLSAAALALIGATDVVWQQLLDETTGKLRIVDYSRPVIRDHFWTGIGRGCFETVFAAYRREPGNHIAQYAENFVIQWIVEWGLPISLIALATLAWTLRPNRLGFGRNALPTGIVVAVSVLLLQNLVDLATEVASVGVATSVLLGTALGGSDYFADTREQVRANRHGNSNPTVANPRRTTSWSQDGVAVVCSILGIALVWFVARTGRPDAMDERSQLATQLTDLIGKKRGDPGFVKLREATIDGLLRHPADPYIPVIGALLSRESFGTPYAWLNQALRRDPLNARPHLLLAETLAARGTIPQALFELRNTYELAPDLLGETAERAARWAASLEDLLRTVPPGDKGIPVLNALALRYSGSAERAAMHEDLLALALSRNSHDVATNLIIAQDLLTAIATNAGTCGGDGRANCDERLRRHAATVIHGASDHQTTTMLTSQILAYEGRYDEAEHLLASSCQRLPDPVSCGSARVSFALKLDNPARFEEASVAYAAAACSTARTCAQAHSWLGNIEVGRNNLLAALKRFERAAQESPTADAWLRVADVALRLGRVGRSETAMIAARRLGAAEGADDLERRLQDMRRERMLDEIHKRTRQDPRQ